MGTPRLAVPSLERLLADGHEILAVYTQPDRPAGRSGAPAPSPVKQAALEHDLQVRQPRSLRRPEEQAALRALAPDLLVVAAYGLILPQAVLDIPRLGGLNVHPSLLPRHRGASPVAGALLAGDAETGVTIMLMDAGMDTGPILAQRRVPVLPDDTAATLTSKLAVIGADLLGETIPLWAEGRLQPQPQDDSLATVTRLLRKEDAALDWTRPAEDLARQVRAYQPWPGTATTWNGKRLEVLEAEAEGPEQRNGEAAALHDIGGPVTVIARGRNGAAVLTGRGLLRLKRVQLEGRRALPIEEFLRGAAGFVGARLGH